MAKLNDNGESRKGLHCDKSLNIRNNDLILTLDICTFVIRNIFYMSGTLFRYLILFFFLFCAFGAYAQIDYKTDQIIVELSEGYGYEELIHVLSSNRNYVATIERKLAQSRHIYLLKCRKEEQSILLRELALDDMFDQVFPPRIISTRKKPNDPKYTEQWTLNKIGLENAWDYTTGGQTADGDEIVVAVLDDGFFLDHPDFEGNIYSNPHDLEGDMNGDGCPGDCGVDDDGDGFVDEDWLGREPGDPGYDTSYRNDDDENGYKDDTNGLNPKTGNDDHPSRSHGSSVSGIIGAKSDNDIGVSSINWNVKIMPLSGGLSEADVIESYFYLIDMRRKYNESNGEKGAFVVACNYSLGIDNGDPDDFKIWCSLYDDMGEQGIINTVATSNSNYNVDVEGDIPSLCPSKYIIAVTSTDELDNFAESAFGPINIDMAAPGEQSYTIAPTKADGYGTFPGTSAATPHVAGAIGLLYSIPCPEFIEYFKTNPSKVDSLAQLVINTGDQLPSLAGLTKSEKRLNVFNAMQELNRFCGSNGADVEVFDLFPNPAYDFLNFSFYADPVEKIYVEIYNILGQKVSSTQVLFPLFQEPQSTINIEGLAPGLYYLSINQGKTRVAAKFIKG